MSIAHTKYYLVPGGTRQKETQSDLNLIAHSVKCPVSLATKPLFVVNANQFLFCAAAEFRHFSAQSLLPMHDGQQ